MLYDSYRLYRLEHAKGPAEIRRDDEQVARLASAVSSPFRAITSAARAALRPYLAARRDGAARLAEPAA